MNYYHLQRFICSSELLPKTLHNLHFNGYTSETNSLKRTNDLQSNAIPKKIKLIPDHFISIQITNPEIHAKITEIHEAALSHSKELGKSIENLVKMHITLDVVNLKTDDCKSRAGQALTSTIELAQKEGLAPILEVQGVRTFSDRVVYASFKKDSGLQQLERLAEICRAELTKHEVIRTDTRPFSPHLTLMKIKRQRSKGMKRFPSAIYSPFSEAYFGSQIVESIQLCSMHKKDPESGYYLVLKEEALIAE